MPTQSWLQNFSGEAGICIDLGGGASLRHNADQRFPAASLIKLPIYLCYRLACEEKTIHPQERIVLRKADMVGGCGRLQREPPGSQFPLGSIADWMLTISDNTATNILIDILGMETINALIQRLGLSATTLERRLMDHVARERGCDNWTSPSDMLDLFRRLLSPTADLAAAAGATLEALKRQTINHKLPYHLPAETVVAHKTGELDDAEHDAGIIYGDQTAAIVVVMTAALRHASQGVALCRQVGAWTHARTETERGLQ